MSEPGRELGWKGSFFVGCGIGVCVLLLVGFVVVWRGKKIERDKRVETQLRLGLLHTCASHESFPAASGAGDDWTGQRNLKISSQLGMKEPVLDGWGNPIRYRCPGPVHKKGWDLWSCGPNGKDDQGTFDDILVGEDVAPVGSR